MSRKILLRKDYGHKISSGRLKNRLVLILGGMASPYCGKSRQKSLIFYQQIHKILGLVSPIQSYNYLPYARNRQFSRLHIVVERSISAWTGRANVAHPFFKSAPGLGLRFHNRDSTPLSSTIHPSAKTWHFPLESELGLSLPSRPFFARRAENGRSVL